MKKITLIIVALTLSIGSSIAQFKKAYEASEVVWLGIDFTQAKFTGVVESPVVIAQTYLESINQVIYIESAKYDLAKFFNKEKVSYDLKMVNELNQKINTDGLVTNDVHKIDSAVVRKIVANYPFEKKDGLGLVFIAENLNKSAKYGSFYVTFIDMATHEIVYSSYAKGVPGGFGFRNFWAASAFNVMKNWEKENR